MAPTVADIIIPMTFSGRVTLNCFSTIFTIPAPALIFSNPKIKPPTTPPAMPNKVFIIRPNEVPPDLNYVSNV
jgi:hypothetical protein